MVDRLSILDGGPMNILEEVGSDPDRAALMGLTGDGAVEFNKLPELVQSVLLFVEESFGSGGDGNFVMDLLEALLGEAFFGELMSAGEDLASRAGLDLDLPGAAPATAPDQAPVAAPQSTPAPDVAPAAPVPPTNM